MECARFFCRPLIVGDTLYATRLDGLSTVVTAFSLNDGQVKWSYIGEDIYFGYIQVAGDIVVLDGFDYGGIFFDTLSVLNRKTGQFLYKLVLPFAFALTDLTLDCDPESGGITAYCKSFDTLVAVHLGKARGHYLWMEAGNFAISIRPWLKIRWSCSAAAAAPRSIAPPGRAESFLC